MPSLDLGGSRKYRSSRGAFFAACRGKGMIFFRREPLDQGRRLLAPPEPEDFRGDLHRAPHVGRHSEIMITRLE